MAPPVIRDRERREYDRITRKAAVDVIQSANYFDRHEYERAFENAEAAARRMVEGLRRLKASMNRESQ